ncbi:MAG: tRNA lysidine(34) synthetase TilS [Desulfobulbaceae bacterium]|nr:tRNA lysidine(34) synthetase TilS [Desulfobulbaceae bacterium]
MTLHPLEYETLQRIRADALLPVGARVVVGVSGGADSLALLLVLAALRAELALELTAVYADHGLRPSEVAAEWCRVAEVCAARGLASRRAVLAVRDHAQEHGLSLEAAGRELRYGLFRRVATELGGAVVAVAHHADDQAEAVLLRLLRGTGRAGLAGMRADNGVGVVRPFLHFPKARLREYLREHQVECLEDSSNTDPRFLRNRVRLALLPFLEERFNPAIRQTLQRTAEILGAEEQLLGELAASFYRQALAEVQPNALALDAGFLLSGHRALQRRVLELALLALAAPVSFRQVEALMRLAGEEGGELHLPAGLRVVKVGGLLRFSYPAGRIRQRGRLQPSGVEPWAVAIVGPGLWPLPGREAALRIEILPGPPAPGELRSSGADYLDLARLSFPLRARSPRPGDRFHPLGAPGRRKVADFLCDRKMPVAERSRLVVLESAGRIAALLGQRIDHSCRLTSATTEVVKVTLVG